MHVGSIFHVTGLVIGFEVDDSDKKKDAKERGGKTRPIH